MITAKEALELYNNSLHTLQKYLDENFHSKVREAAMQGKREYMHFTDSCEGSLPKPSILESKAIAELQKLGYSVNYMFSGDSYVPRGLANDDGEGPEYQCYGIRVKW